MGCWLTRCSPACPILPRITFILKPDQANRPAYPPAVRQVRCNWGCVAAHFSITYTQNYNLSHPALLKIFCISPYHTGVKVISFFSSWMPLTFKTPKKTRWPGLQFFRSPLTKQRWHGLRFDFENYSEANAAHLILISVPFREAARIAFYTFLGLQFNRNF